MVIHRGVLLWAALVCADHWSRVDNQVKPPSRVSSWERVLLFTRSDPRAGINQMIKAHPGYVHLLQQVKYSRYLIYIAFVDGKTKTDLDPGILTISNPPPNAAWNAPGHTPENGH